MKPLYIFDIDGTIADLSHRLHYIKTVPKDWDSFNARVIHDTPIKPVLEIMHSLYKAGTDVYFFTGRNESTRAATTEWIYQNTFWDTSTITQSLFMRPLNDRRDDTQVKKDIYLNHLNEYDKNRLTSVFEDRDRVVKMWRKLGVTCLQVRDGNY